MVRWGIAREYPVLNIFSTYSLPSLSSYFNSTSFLSTSAIFLRPQKALIYLLLTCYYNPCFSNHLHQSRSHPTNTPICTAHLYSHPLSIHHCICNSLYHVSFYLYLHSHKAGSYRQTYPTLLRPVLSINLFKKVAHCNKHFNKDNI